MKEVVSSSAVFFSYALLAIFAQNAVFTRALGVSRMVQLVGDDRTSSALFGMMLCITQVLVAPVAFIAGGFIAPLDNRAQLRPLVYIASIAVVCLAEHLVLWLLRSLPRRAQLLRIVPLAALNSGVLGILCAVWRAAAAKRKEYLQKEARDTLTVHYQKEVDREP